MSKHCGHCVDACSGGVVRGVKIPHEDGEGAEWTGKCPACVEAERVAVAIWMYACDLRVASMGLSDAVENAFSKAIHIARSET